MRYYLTWTASVEKVGHRPIRLHTVEFELVMTVGFVCEICNSSSNADEYGRKKNIHTTNIETTVETVLFNIYFVESQTGRLTDSQFGIQQNSR